LYSGGGNSNSDSSAPVGEYAISGSITLNGAALVGATVTLSGASSATTTTDANGNYSFTGLDNGSYTVTPSSKPIDNVSGAAHRAYSLNTIDLKPRSSVSSLLKTEKKS
jgi:hypothetical protein